MPEGIEEFTSPEQAKRLFQHEAGTMPVEYLLAVGKVFSLYRMLVRLREDVPELDQAFERRFGEKLERLLGRYPQQYRRKAEIQSALHELDLAWNLDDDTFLSTLRALHGRPAPAVEADKRKLSDSPETDAVN